MTLKQIQQRTNNHKEFYLFSSAFAGLYYINKKLGNLLINNIEKIDNIILKIFPRFKKVSWVTVAKIEKNGEKG